MLQCQNPRTISATSGETNAEKYRSASALLFLHGNVSGHGAGTHSGGMQNQRHVIGSGDALHPEWRKMWEPYVDNEFGITVIPQTEVEDSSRVHHVILAETFDQFAELQDMFEPVCGHLTTAGRPHLQLGGEEIATAVHD